VPQVSILRPGPEHGEAVQKLNTQDPEMPVNLLSALLLEGVSPCAMHSAERIERLEP
jgi:hypothetical protein